MKQFLEDIESTVDRMKVLSKEMDDQYLNPDGKTVRDWKKELDSIRETLVLNTVKNTLIHIRDFIKMVI